MLFRCLAPLLLVAQALAGSIDNSAVANTLLKKASTLSGAGNYHIVNVATGHSLHFVREGSPARTNVWPQPKYNPVAVEFSGKQARLSGLSKCLSAQWSTTATSSGGANNAAVSYGCQVGSGVAAGSSTLELAKQWWYLSAGPSVGTYYIIATQHLQDMPTRAVGGSAMATVGGYTSTVLPLWNSGDKSQLWKITKV